MLVPGEVISKVSFHPYIDPNELLNALGASLLLAPSSQSHNKIGEHLRSRKQQVAHAVGSSVGPYSRIT